MDDDDGLSRVADLLAGPGRAGSLSSWLTRNHDGFAQVLDGLSHTDWRRVSAALAEIGLRDARGEAPSPETARKAWQRAQKLVADRRRKWGAAAEEPAQPARPSPPSDVVFINDERRPSPRGPIDEIRRRLAARSGIEPGND